MKNLKCKLKKSDFLMLHCQICLLHFAIPSPVTAPGTGTAQYRSKWYLNSFNAKMKDEFFREAKLKIQNEEEARRAIASFLILHFKI